MAHWHVTQARENNMSLCLAMVHWSSVVCCAAAMGVLFSAGVIPSFQDMAMAATLDNGDQQLLETGKLLSWCIIGACVGAWMYISFVPDKNPTPIRMAQKYMASLGCGVTLTPITIHFCGLPKDTGFAAGIATLVAFFGIGILVDAGPSVIAWAKKKFLGGP